jgi:hypothetical protein
MEERALIHEIIKFANQCMLGEPEEIKLAIDSLE